MSRQWQQLPERGSVTALRLIHWIALRLGRPAGRLALYPIIAYFLLLAPSPRRASRAYLRRVLGRDPGWLGVFRHFYVFAATILDRVYLLAGQFERFAIEVHNGPLLLDQVASGQGCLLLGSHLGSFEVLRVLGASYRRFPLKVLMNIAHNQAITRFLNTLNPELADTIIPIQGPETLLKVQDALADGYLIGTLGDRVVADDKRIRCRFLDGEAFFPAGPLLLAVMLQCPVILCFGLYRGGNRYDVYFERLAERITAPSRQRQAVVAEWVQRYAERLEHYTREAPYNWFNFYPFWEDDRS